MESSPGSRWLRRSRLCWAGPCTSREDMEEEAPVTAATGALGPVIAKLAALLGSEYKLRRRTQRDIKFIRSKLNPVHSILWNIWEREELDEPSMALKMEALDLADELDDVIFDFILSMERSPNNKRLVQTKIKASPFQDFKKRASDVSGRYRSNWKEKQKPAVTSPGEPRAYPFVRKDASELVGMVKPRDKLIQHLNGEDDATLVELQLKKAFIYGTAGMGKTTLADLVYEEIGNKFESRAFVSVTPGGNMCEVLARILQQVAARTSLPVAGTQAYTEERLIDIISTILKDKRYLVIIDDIRNWREWEVIMKSLPENNLGSRIVGTTRIKSVSKKWRDGPGNVCLIHKMLPKWDRGEGWVYPNGLENIATPMIAMKSDLVAEGFDNKHPIVRMCGGMPLAVCCMLSAVAQEREKQAQQGLPAQTCDVQAEIKKHVTENGIQNTPGFEPLVESLQLGFDDLPHHMLKTCLLYCSIYPDGHIFEKDNLVRRWISERFVCEEEEANGYFEELVNRGLIQIEKKISRMIPWTSEKRLRIHPMMQNFLRWKSRQDNFITCSSEITPSSNNTCRIRRLCIYNSPYGSTNAVDPLPALDWYHVRSLVVYEGIERVPLEKLEGVRVLDFCSIKGLQDHHLKDICGLVRVRHLLGLNGDGRNSEIPPEIARLQCLETLEARGFTRLPGFIENLQLLKTLELRSLRMEELPREIGALQQLQTLRITGTSIAKLPREIGELQQLRTLDISHTWIKELPKEIGKLQQLKTFDMSDTQITVLPKEIGKLQHLEQLLMIRTRVAKLPREIGALKELKSLKFYRTITAVPLEVCAWGELPECIHQAVNRSGLVSELAGEMLSFQKSVCSNHLRVQAEGGLVVGAKQMHIPPWIKEHFNDLLLLDIRICKLEEGGLKILREMPNLHILMLRFEVVPIEPVVISSEGFAQLCQLTIDSRVPRVTFQEGAMPMLELLTFKFYSGPPNKDPVGTNHLRSLRRIYFECNEEWYQGGDSTCIRPMIDIVRKEAQELPNIFFGLYVCGRYENTRLPPTSPPPPPLEIEQGEMDEEEGRSSVREKGSSSGTGQMEKEDEERSSGMGEIKEDMQA